MSCLIYNIGRINCQPTDKQHNQIKLRQTFGSNEISDYLAIHVIVKYGNSQLETLEGL